MAKTSIKARLDLNDPYNALNQEKLKRIHENEKKLIEQLLKQCTRDTAKGETQIGDITVTHYLLPTGQHVYKNNQEDFIIVNSEMDVSEIKDFFNKERKLPDNCTAIYNDYGANYHYVAIDSGKCIFSAVTGRYGKGYTCQTKIPMKNWKEIDLENVPETLIEIVDETLRNSAESLGDNIGKEGAELIINGFHELLQSTERNDLVVKTEAEMRIEELQKENQRLKEQNEALSKENMSLKERFLRVRKFLTERCAKIPFFGKRLIRAMKEELGEHELPEGTSPETKAPEER